MFSLVVMLALGGPVSRAADIDNQLESLQADLQRVSEQLDEITTNYESRRGLIGSVEARIRYEDAVYAYLIGDYDRAANSFFVLVESESLANPALHRDSEWYLAESLFELGNYETSISAYSDIIAVGPTHPFFADAVRRQLEIFGILRDVDRFYDLYNKYIVTGKVPTTDLVKYTVAKAFYRQGEHGRAIELLQEIQPDSFYHARAGYMLGTVHAAQGAFEEAIPAFVKITEIQPRNSLDTEVIDLAHLAAARLYYETGDYASSVDHYIEISSESEYFADELYELVWTFIKQEEYGDAIRAIDTFLIAFPEHRYAMQLKLLRGHLHMKSVTYDEALAAYEEVVAEFSPVRDSLHEIDLSTDDPVAFLGRVAEADAIEVAGEALPSYAAEMLFANEHMLRAKKLHLELRDQSDDLTTARMLIDEVQGVLSSSDQSIGTFAWGRRQISGLRNESMRLMSTALKTELDYLIDNVPDKMRPELRQLRGEVESLVDKAQAVQSAATTATDRSSVYESQIRAVQNRAFKVRHIVGDLQAQVQSLRTFLDTSTHLSDADRKHVAEELDRQDAELSDMMTRLERMMGDTARRELMSHVDTRPVHSVQAIPERGDLMSQYKTLANKVRGYRGDVAASDRAEVFGSLDAIWAKVTDIDTQARTAEAKLDQAEGRELTVLKDRLARESGNVMDSSVKLDKTNEDAADLVGRVATHGLGALQDEFDNAILRADMGIVDVYWLRKTNNSDEITDLFQERATQLRELDQKYGIVKQKLED